MGLRRALAAISAVIGLAVAAPPALAHGHFTSGIYSGTVRQSLPRTYSGTIAFRIHNHRLSALHFTVTMVCAKVLIAQVSSPPSSLQLPVARDGSFSYSGTLNGTNLQLQGVVHGHRATGTFFEAFQTTPGDTCTMLAPAPFGGGVQHQVAPTPFGGGL